MRGLIQLQNTLQMIRENLNPGRRDRGHPADAGGHADDPRQGGDRDPRGELRRPRVRLAHQQDGPLRGGPGEGHVGAQVRSGRDGGAVLPRTREGGPRQWQAVKASEHARGPAGGPVPQDRRGASPRPTPPAAARARRRSPPRRAASRASRRGRSRTPACAAQPARRRLEEPRVPTPQERLRHAFSSDIPENMLERAAGAEPARTTRTPTRRAATSRHARASAGRRSCASSASAAPASTPSTAWSRPRSRASSSSPSTPTCSRCSSRPPTSRCTSAQTSPAASARAPTRTSAAPRRWRTTTASRRCSRARTWSSSPPAPAAAPAPAPRRSSRASPASSAR